MKKNRYVKAYRSMCRLRHSEVLAARDLYYAHVQLVAEQEVSSSSVRPIQCLRSQIIQGRTYFSRFAELFTIPRVRRATLAASTVMLAQQMCGINSRSSSVLRPKQSLTLPSHCVLLFDHLRQLRLYRFPSLVRLSRFRSRQLRLRLPRHFHHRHVRSTIPPACDLPKHGLDPAHDWYDVLHPGHRKQQGGEDRADRSVSPTHRTLAYNQLHLPLRRLLQCRGRTGAFHVFCRGLPLGAT